MRVSSAAVERQSANMAALGASARRALENGVPNAKDIPALLRQVTQAYSTMSAALAATYYSSIRKASRVRSKYTAEPFTAYDAGKVTAATEAILSEVSEGRATVALEALLADLVSRYIKDSADACIRGNVRKDPAKPKFAIVPNGDACAFCQMRASLGYTYADEDAIESHDHCTCVATPVFGDSTIQGYDPSVYRDRYDEAARAYRNGDISDELKERIEAQKAEKGRDFGSTNAILMVMREQQGIK